MSKTAKKIVFSGVVQGVGFRFTARNIGNRNMLTGYVRNMPDGTVEMLGQGEEEDIEGAISDLKETFAGHIKDIQSKEVSFDSSYEGFEIKF